MGLGPSYFLTDKTLKRHIDNTLLFGGNYAFNNKRQSLIFNPGLRVQINDYHARLANKNKVHVTQHALGIHLDALMKLSRTGFLRVGLFCSRILYSYVVLSWENNAVNNYSASSDLNRDYSPATNQAGFNIGYNIPFRLFNRKHKFNITFQHVASRLVNSDYSLNKTLVGETITVLSAKARPSMLTLGFDFNLKQPSKKKNKEEDG